MKKAITFLIFLAVISCNSKDPGDKKVAEKESMEIPKAEARTSTNKSIGEELNTTANNLLDTITLYEKRINQIPLPFPQKDMTMDLEKLFTGFQVNKEIGQQDGPDFPLYNVSINNNQIIFMAMDHQDSLKLDAIYLKDSLIQDQYGIRVGDTFSNLKSKRGKGKIQFDPYHYHMYYHYSNSKIYYELTGELKTPEFENVSDINITEEDIKNWKIEYIIWRN